MSSAPCSMKDEKPVVNQETVKMLRLRMSALEIQLELLTRDIAKCVAAADQELNQFKHTAKRGQPSGTLPKDAILFASPITE